MHPWAEADGPVDHGTLLVLTVQPCILPIQLGNLLQALVRPWLG